MRFTVLLLCLLGLLVVVAPAVDASRRRNHNTKCRKYKPRCGRHYHRVRCTLRKRRRVCKKRCRKCRRKCRHVTRKTKGYRCKRRRRRGRRNNNRRRNGKGDRVVTETISPLDDDDDDDYTYDDDEDDYDYDTDDTDTTPDVGTCANLCTTQALATDGCPDDCLVRECADGQYSCTPEGATPGAGTVATTAPVVTVATVAPVATGTTCAELCLATVALADVGCNSSICRILTCPGGAGFRCSAGGNVATAAPTVSLAATAATVAPITTMMTTTTTTTTTTTPVTVSPCPSRCALRTEAEVRLTCPVTVCRVSACRVQGSETQTGFGCISVAS